MRLNYNGLASLFVFLHNDFLTARLKLKHNDMKKSLLLCACALLGMTAEAQTARKLTVSLTPDGEANIQVFLPQNPICL